MSYEAFLVAMTQLAGRRKARMIVEDSVVFLEEGKKKNQWSFFTKVFDGEGFVPSDVRSCVSSTGSLRWQSNGSSLKLDSDSIFLIQEVVMEKGKYIPFRHHLKRFIKTANEWRNLLKAV